MTTGRQNEVDATQLGAALGSAKHALKRLRQSPGVNAPVTNTVRGLSRLMGVTPEFAIKHLPRTGTTRATLPNGSELQLWSRGDDWVSNQVFWRGWNGYDTEVGDLFWRLAEKARLVVDVGAHVGYYALLAARANPVARVLALEPLPVVFERLERNVALNRLSNIVTLQLAAGAVDGTATFYYVPGRIPSSSGLSEGFMLHTAGISSLEVEVKRMDTLAGELSIGSIDLMKIDTETTEPDVLAGMGQMLGESQPDIVCEVLSEAAVDRLQSILAPLDYRFFLLTDGGPQRRETITPDAQWLNYLFTARGSVS